MRRNVTESKLNARTTSGFLIFVVGRTDEVGVQIPPLHPRCRCVIIYRELTSRSTNPKPRITDNVQPLSVYETQIQSHGGSGNVKPDKVISGHDRTPSKSEPLNIIDHKDYRGLIDKRIFYDKDGRPYFEINTTNHGNPKNHPFGSHGEHAHDITWSNGKANRTTRELTAQERKDNGDIL